MTVLDARSTLSGSVYPLVNTNAASDDELASSQRDVQKNRGGWQRMIDDYLVEWGRDPSRLEDEGIVAPSVAIITWASQVAMKLRDARWPAPLRVVADGEGGIAFERRAGTLFESLNIGADGSLELVTFNDCRLQSRVRLLGAFATA